MKKGISLISLIITIVVIIILSGIIVFSLVNTNVVKNANETKYKSDLKNLDEEVRMAIQKKYISDRSILNKKITDIEEIKKYSPNLANSEYIEYAYISSGVLTLNGSKLTEEQRNWAIEAKIKIDDNIDIEGIVQILLVPTGETVLVLGVNWTRYNINASISYNGQIPEGYVIQYKIDDGDFIDYIDEIEIEKNSTIVARLYNKSSDSEAAFNSKDITTIDKTPPTAPILDENNIIVDVNKIVVKASGSKDALSGVKGYKFSVDGINYTRLYNEEEECLFENLTSNKSYKIYAKAVDFVGNESTNSIIQSVSTLPQQYEVKYDANGGLGGPSNQVKYEGQELILSSVVPQRQGYDFSGWGLSASSKEVSYNASSKYNIDESITLYAIWNPSKNTKYKINYYIRDLGANTYTLESSYEKYGTTGEKISVDDYSKTIEGFTFSVAKIGQNAVKEAIISANGTLELNLYYTRNSYTVTLNKGTGISSVSGAGTYEYGSQVTIDAYVSVGYTWEKWEDVTSQKEYSFTMAAQNVYLTASASPNNNVRYVVNYYVKDILASTYSLNDSEEKTGITDTNVNVSDFAKEIQGFTYSNTKVGQNVVTEAVILGDGSLVIDLYYTRNKYSVKLNKENGITEVSGAGEYEYQQEITIDATLENGFIWNGWQGDLEIPKSTKRYSFKVPSSNLNLTASAIANSNTKYTVNHYITNIGSSSYTLDSSEEKYGVTGQTVKISDFVRNITGFTYKVARIGQNVVTEAVILGDGSLVINLYYIRNKYTVTLNKGVGISSVSGAGTYEYGSQVTLDAILNAGYTFKAWTGTNETTVKKYIFTMPSSNVEYMATATVNTDTKYIVNHYTKDLNKDTYTLESSKEEKGTTNSTIKISNYIKSIEGFTYSNAKIGQNVVTEAVILGDGLLVVDLYYTRNSYTVTLSKGTGISSLSGAGTYEYGSQVTLDAILNAGYTFKAWTGTNETTVKKYTFTMPSSNVEYMATATVNTDTKYIVNHYTKDLNKDTYTLESSKEEKGTTNSTIKISNYVKSIEGFTYSNAKIGQNVVTEAVILGDGSLVVDLYYTRNSYAVTLNKGTGISSVSGAGTYEYGSQVTLDASLDTGYAWKEWLVENSSITSKKYVITITRDITYTANATPNTDTKYIINYYIKELSSETYALQSSEEKTGITGESVNINECKKYIEGFTYSNAKIGQNVVTEAVILGDGSLVVDLYYTRNSYTVTLNKGTGISSVSGAGTYEYESQVTLDATASVGYTFDSWTGTKASDVKKYTFTMPNSNVENTANATPNTDTKYVVNHYIKNVGSDTYTLDSTENKTGTTATKVKVSDYIKEITGFTYSNSKVATIEVTEAVVSGDGSLVINMYYTRNSYTVTLNKGTGISSVSGAGTYEYQSQVTLDATASVGYTFDSWTGTKASDVKKYTFTMPNSNVENTANATPNTDTKYVVNHYIKNVGSDTYTLDSTENKTGTTATKVKVSDYIKEITGFTYSNSKVATIEVTEAVVSGDGSLVINMYYTRNSYTVTLNKGTGISSVSGAGTYEYQSQVTLDATASVGYTFDSWIGTKASNVKKYTFTMPNSNVENTANATPNTDTKYVVNHYIKNVGSDTYTLNSSEEKSGVTDSKIQVSNFVKSIAGFTYSNTKVGQNVVTEAVISGDGSLVIDLYYTRNSYTVTLNKGTGISSVSGAGTYEHGSSVTINAQVSAGYSWSSWNGTKASATMKYTFTMPIGNVSNTASAKANQYSVTLNSNGGTAPSTTTSKVTYNSTYGTLLDNTSTREGYTFAGWYTDKTAGTKITSSTKVQITSNITLYAHWEPKWVKIKFMRNINSSDTESFTKTFYAGDSSTKMTNDKNWTNPGYILVYWSRSRAGGYAYAIGNGTNAKWIEANAGKTITAYGIWLPENAGDVTFTNGTYISVSTNQSEGSKTVTTHAYLPAGVTIACTVSSGGYTGSGGGQSGGAGSAITFNGTVVGSSSSGTLAYTTTSAGIVKISITASGNGGGGVTVNSIKNSYGQTYTLKSLSTSYETWSNGTDLSVSAGANQTLSKESIINVPAGVTITCTASGGGGSAGGGGGSILFNDTSVASKGGGTGSGASGTITYTTTETGTLKIRAYASAGPQSGGNGSIKLTSITMPNGISYD